MKESSDEIRTSIGETCNIPEPSTDSLTNRRFTNGHHYSQWESLMRRFSEDCKAENCSQACIQAVQNITCELRPPQKFWTGSTYFGTWDSFGMSGYGIYTFPDGAVYEGEFEANMQHGDGVLRYPNGIQIHGTWVNGELANSDIVMSDGISYQEKDWKYCTPSDRRFAMEYNLGIQPAGRTLFLADVDKPKVPKGCYDVGDGFYDPKTDAVYDYKDFTHILRVPSMTAREWIMKNCRASDDIKPIGPQPQLYKEWVQPKMDYEPSLPFSLDNEEIEERLLTPQEDIVPTVLKPQGSAMMQGPGVKWSKRLLI